MLPNRPAIMLVFSSVSHAVPSAGHCEKWPGVIKVLCVQSLTTGSSPCDLGLGIWTVRSGHAHVPFKVIAVPLAKYEGPSAQGETEKPGKLSIPF